MRLALDFAGRLVMNIVEALRKSKVDGRQYSRMSGGGWVAWDPDHTYRIEAEDMVADDWVTSAELIQSVTKGRWALNETPAVAIRTERVVSEEVDQGKKG